MKKFLSLATSVLFALALLALVGCSGGTTSATSPSSMSNPNSAMSGGGGTPVNIENMLFNPGDVTINAGGNVTWKNADSTAHTVTGEGWQSGTLSPGASFSHTFDKAGTYEYHCAIYDLMKGKVTVK
jgi:plastocyanin